MSTDLPTRNRKMAPRFSERRHGEVESAGTEARGEAVDFRSRTGINDTDEWKPLESDRAQSGTSIFDLDDILEESDFEHEATSGQPMTAADKPAARDCCIR